MTAESEKTMIEKIKAAAFPVTLGIVVFFLIAFYNEFKDQSKTQDEIKTEVQKQSSRFDLIEFRLNLIEKNQGQQMYNKHMNNGE